MNDKFLRRNASLFTNRSGVVIDERKIAATRIKV